VSTLNGVAVRSIVVGLATLLAACGGPSSTDDPAKPRVPGEQTYERFCISCHASGISGAPPIGNADAWRPRLAQGEALMLKHTRDGMPSGGMPPNGLCSACTDQDLLDAIHYMTNAKP
jgi:cytochrome c5